MSPEPNTSSHIAESCPMCGQFNQCQRFADGDTFSCWCIDADIPPKSQAPDIANESACICQSCIEHLAKLARLSPKSI
ncbi:cysteine-rich CWC family protein [Shewanella gelidii]|uniref:cysteine-rich CWC family protein n=1 Tax=Shewanella gelidii TaxID=1642821 RepID=UPI00166C0911|nr:cysteine-rich CWC family protein [Shewanella gelidii]MCL1097615.1 cysteine-rich CWC family protein [Shewanella gelidii]